ncbi:MAG: hypothetical protein II825_02385 [Paludibacteraceae bacterium]|nr:hypothetical protein [Paludibacteraceae bacterium]
MKTYVRYAIICLFTLSSALCGAESRTVSQNFNDMYGASPKTLTVTNTNHTGTTDFVTYTCSGGAEFFNNANSGNKLAIFLDASGEQVQTTQVTNLDSLRIFYAANAYKDMTVSIKEGEGAWTEVPVVQKQKGLSTVKMPRVGDYYVRIARKGSDNVYITEIGYIYIDLSGCPNCFIYKP